ncbi:Ppx/GppA family phosphatase [Streptomyces sp. NPDC056479]|uniref:Ppx/GppA phosphatase family protein n=1 Tax=unclassified Streptomyces TaxID=2593676 RepID=UPI0036A2FD26
MRISVLDTGSNTVRLAVCDVGDGVPLPVHTAKWKLRLSEHVDGDGRLGEEATERLVKALSAAVDMARQWDAPEPLAFATAVVRDAPDRADVLDTVHSRTGLRLRVLPGEAEARLTFLGARRWMGWRSGPLALFDIGGGTLEVAFGRGRTPEFAASLPLGANRLTNEFFRSTDPPTTSEVLALRRKVRHELRDVSARIRWEHPHTAVATSRTFQQLARLCGTAPGRHGPFIERVLSRRDLRRAADRLVGLSIAERAGLPGISAPRARQSLAGAIIGHSAMKLSGLKNLVICPWALREGILLRYLEEGADWWADLERCDALGQGLDGVAVVPRPLRVASPSPVS